MNELLREFLVEADDLIESLFADIEELGKKFEQGPARRVLIGRIFRHAHTIKGTASAAELEVTAGIAHELETVLDSARLGRLTLNREIINLFTDSTAAIAESLRAAATGKDAVLPGSLIDRLRTASKSSSERDAAAIEQITALLPIDIASTLSQYEQQKLREAVAEQSHIFLITVDFDLENFDESFRSLSSSLSEKGELISTLPGLAAVSPDKMNFRILHATVEKNGELNERVRTFEPTAVFELTPAPLKATEAEPEESDDQDLELSDKRDRPLHASPQTSVVRVELAELDEMISDGHDLLIETLSTLDLTLSMDLLPLHRTELELRASRIRRRFRGLEERLIGLRMIPLGPTLLRAARAGSLAARTLGKEVEIETLGGEVLLDKSVADAVSEPLLHLLRNAVSHGIEAPEIRRNSGKQECGKIVIEAVAEGSRVLLRINDDGQGIDPEVVAKAAMKRGLIDEGTILTRQQSLRLIFRPGFTTSSTVSTVSGRGVGLDVVENAAERVGGELRVWSEIGIGTSFELILPTTLSLASSLVVSAADYRYTIDTSHILEAGYIDSSQILRDQSGETIEWRGRKMPLVQLRTLLGHQEQAYDISPRHHVVISHIAGQEQLENEIEEGSVPRSAAVVVDGWDGHSEVLVRSLGRHAAKWRGVSGASELNDGNLALVLDLPRLLEAHVGLGGS
jgi:two-component system chemotaxis sensor kinase CheA